MLEGQSIGLMDSEGNTIKMGDKVRVKVWSYPEGTDYNVEALIVWDKCAICLRRLDGGEQEEKFMSCFYLESSLNLTIIQEV